MIEELKVALIQSPLVWENPEANRALFSNKMEAIPPDVDLVVLPEMFSTGFTMAPENIDREEGERTLEWMKSTAISRQVALVGSVSFFVEKNYVNRLFFVHPSGLVEHYDKRHTFTLAGEDKVYRAGVDRLVVDYKGFRFCPLICYDLRFPVWARNTENFDVLLYVANWPNKRINAWDILLRARAIENMVYCIGANRVGTDASGHEYSGHSAVYDSLGETVVFSEAETILYATLKREHLEKNREHLKFLQDRDSFSLTD
jgi:predicted amidohydrolase